jgi:hypothetical protein
MSSVALGTQKVSIAYNDTATTQTFNQINHKVLKDGIYDGGSLSHLSGVITLAPFVSSLRTSTGEAVNIKTTSNITVDTSLPVTESNPFADVSELKPYIVGNFTWENAVRYLDFSAKGSGELYSNDVIFAKTLFSGGVITEFDYTEKTYGTHDQDSNSYQNSSVIITNKSIPTLTSGLVITSDIEEVSGQLNVVSYLNGTKSYIPISFT